MSADAAEKKFPPPLPNPAAHPVKEAGRRPSAGAITLETAGDEPTPGRGIPLAKPESSTAAAHPLPHPLMTPKNDDEVTDPSFGSPEQAPPPPPTQGQVRAATPPGSAVKLPELGSIDALMRDPEITEIMINDLRNVMIERNGKLIFSGLAFQSLDELNRIMRNLLESAGRSVTPDSPYADFALPDGSRVNVVVPPLVQSGPCITIRKFPKRITVEGLMKSGSMDQRIAYFLNVCVVARLNIVVSGGTGSGKTTLLNILSGFIPKGERVVTIEDTPELVIGHENSVRMQTKPRTPGGEAVTTRDLVANALRMRPDRIVVGEVRRAEAFDMLQAMNTGHEGSMTTLHANSPRDALSRLETLCLLAGVELPLLAIRKQIVSAVDLLVQIRRFRDGKRRVVAISEVTGIEGDTITTQDIFVFESGGFRALGLVPSCLDRIRDAGIELPPNYFG